MLQKSDIYIVTTPVIVELEVLKQELGENKLEEADVTMSFMCVL